MFDAIQNGRTIEDSDFVPLNITAVFSPPADVSPDVKQLQEDLPQEQEDNKDDPDGKKQALSTIIAHYNERFGTNHRIEEFDLYYQDVQKRIKDQQFPNEDFRKIDPAGKHQHKLDIVIVVDMLLTGFDSKYLNTLYVDKTLKHHALIQAFSRTNRVLNDTKPYGHILDFRNQQESVDAAIQLFSGVKVEQARKIWLVEPSPVVIGKLQEARAELASFMLSQGLTGKPEDIGNLSGNAAKAAFIEHFKKIQKLQTQLDQYTDLTPDQEQMIETVLPKDELRAFRGQYLETADELRKDRKPTGGAKPDPAVEQLDFEFVLFASAMIDYDYIIKLITDFQAKPAGKATMSREQLIGLIAADSKFIDERELITEYVRGLKAGQGLDEAAIRTGYQRFKDQKHAAELTTTAHKHGLSPASLQKFVDAILNRMIFDGEQLTELLGALDLGWRARAEKELALMADLVPILKKRSGGRDISGLQAYEE